jgi:hypothetical protein
VAPETDGEYQFGPIISEIEKYCEESRRGRIFFQQQREDSVTALDTSSSGTAF